MKTIQNFYLIICFLIVSYLTIGKTSAQWESIGPEGGYIKCMTLSGSKLYAVTSGRALYSSTNNGNNWTYLNSINLPVDIRAFATIGNMLFLGTGSGLYRSDDNGASWVLKTNGFPVGGNWVNKLAVSDTTLFAAATTAKILRSTDFGENWTIQATGITCNDIYALTATPTTIFTGGGSNRKGVFRSTDNGDTWQQVTTGMYYFYNGAPVYGYAPNIQSLGYNGTDLYAATNGFQGIWKSSDNGDNWVMTGTETRNNQIYNAVIGDGSTVYAASHANGIFRSTNNGTSWTVANTGIDIYHTATSFLIYGSSVFTGTKAGIYRTTNSGLNWTNSDAGICGNSTTFGGLVSIGSDIFAGTNFGGVFRSSNAGSSWSKVNNGLPLNQNVSYYTNIYSSSTTLFGYGLMSTDNGDSWGAFNSPGGSSWSNEKAWIEHGTGKFAIKSYTDMGVYRSMDNGATWNLVNNGIDPNSSVFVSIYSDGTTLYVGTDVAYYYSTDNGDNWIAGLFPDYNSWSFSGACFTITTTARLMGISGGGGERGIYRTTDSGANWIKVNDLLVHKFVVSENNIWVSGTNLEDVNGILTEVPAVLLSQNDGQNWIKISGTLSVSTYSIVTEGTNIYTEIDSPVNDIFRSSNNGVNWISIGAGLNPNTEVTTLTVLNNRIYAGTQGHSLWVRNLDDFLLPSQPSIITGTASPCIGSSQTYYVTNVSGVTYSWQFPTGWIITSGGTTNSITVTVGNNTGFVIVTPSNAFGSGPSQVLPVNPIISPPSQPSTIAGSATPLQNSSQIYSVTNVAGTTYTWTFPSDWIQTAGGTTNSVTVTVGIVAGNVTCTPSNDCGNGTASTLAVVPSGVGINEFNESNYISVFPNPTKGIVAITFKGIDNNITLKLQNIQGSLVYTTNFDAVSDNFTRTLDLSKYPNGMYYLQVISDGKTFTKKLVKQ